jgi:nucleoid DNA-binding protein
MAKAAPAKKAPSKTEVTRNIAEATDLKPKQVAAVLEALGEEIKKALGNRGPGVFAIPGLVKIVKRRVPARPARKNAEVRDIRTGQVTIKDIPAKPAYNKVAVRALKNLKGMV